MVSPGLESSLLEIWDRTKKNIDVSQLKFGTEEQMAEQLKSILESSSKNSKAVKNLISAGFHEAAVRNSSIINELSLSRMPAISETFIPKQKFFPTDGKIKVKVKGRTRTYSKQNIRLSETTYKGKPAFYVFNAKTGKRITWGLKEAVK